MVWLKKEKIALNVFELGQILQVFANNGWTLIAETYIFPPTQPEYGPLTTSDRPNSGTRNAILSSIFLAWFCFSELK